MAETLYLHGQPVSYTRAGSGPVLLLLHGITSSSRTWDAVVPALAERFTVIAPDLLGHGQSGKPRGDYSLGAYASGVRDLLMALGVRRATVVGHSLGGGIAMQLAYQFPERVERLVLVSSGGLGDEVALLLRAATLPGAEHVLPLLRRGWARKVGRVAGRGLELSRLRTRADLDGLATGIASFAEASARTAFLHTARSILDVRGQRVSAADRLYLAEEMPTLIVWGERDRMIPVAHGRAAAELIPRSRLEVFERAGHFPFNEDPQRFVDVLADFMATTEPAAFDEDRIRAMLLARSVA